MSFTAPFSRRHDLDALRVIAFGLLIFYHIGMFYVSWGWHVKSAYASPAAEPLMLILNPWRLALLFFISGVAVRFASDKAPVSQFIGSRVFRLGVPILFGMIFIVMPQSYFQLREAGEVEPGIFTFWWEYLALEETFSITTPTWNHLWYIVYLLTYILLLAPVYMVMRTGPERPPKAPLSRAVDHWWKVLLIVPLPFILYEYVLAPSFPTTHALVGDWANHAHRLTIFLLGYFVAKDEKFWRVVKQGLPIWLLGAIGLQIALYYINIPWTAAFRATSWAQFIVDIYPIVATLYAWCAILSLLAFAQRFLNRPSPLIRYLNGGVFCYYILHQTIIVAAGYALTRLELGVWPEFALILVITCAGCAAGYEILRRIPVLKWGFGIK